MTKDDTYDQGLYIFCSNNNIAGVKAILGLSDTIDVMAGNGILFQIALSHRNHEMCATLLSFFENKQNPSDAEKERLKDILEEATSFANVSPEMQKVLKNYIPIDDTRLSDVTSVDLDTVFDNTHEEETTAPRNSSISTDDNSIQLLELTEENLRKWHSEKHSTDNELIGVTTDIQHDT